MKMAPGSLLTVSYPRPYTADEFLAEFFAGDDAITALVGNAIYRDRAGLVPASYPYILIRRAPLGLTSFYGDGGANRGQFTCTAVSRSDKITDDRAPEEVVAPIVAAMLDRLAAFEDGEQTYTSDSGAVWGAQIIKPDFSQSYTLGDSSVAVVELGPVVIVTTT